MTGTLPYPLFQGALFETSAGTLGVNTLTVSGSAVTLALVGGQQISLSASGIYALNGSGTSTLINGGAITSVTGTFSGALQASSLSTGGAIAAGGALSAPSLSIANAGTFGGAVTGAAALFYTPAASTTLQVQADATFSAAITFNQNVGSTVTSLYKMSTNASTSNWQLIAGSTLVLACTTGGTLSAPNGLTITGATLVGTTNSAAISASGSISATGSLVGGSVTSNGTLAASGAITGPSVTTTGSITAGGALIGASGTITGTLSVGGNVIGTAASKAASASGAATLASVSGAITAGHLATFADTAGTIQDGGAVPGAYTLPAAATGALGGVFAGTAPSHQWLSAIGSSTGSLTFSQPSIADISGLGDATTSVAGLVAAPILGGLIVDGSGNLSYPLMRGFDPNGWYPCAPFDFNPVSTAVTFTAAGALYALPIWIPTRMKMTGMSIKVNTASSGGGLVRFGIGSPIGGGLLTPSALIADFGTVSTDATGAATATISSGPTLTAGWYNGWINISSIGTGANPVLACAPPGGRLNDLIGSPTPINALSNGAGTAGWVDTGYSSTGTLPSTFATATILTAANVPAFAIKGTMV